MRRLPAAVLAALAAATGAAAAEQPDEWADRLILNVRLRQEWVDQEAFAADASALTIGTRFGLETPRWKGLALLAEGENVAHLTAAFHDGVNGKTAYPLVPDPEATELNRLEISFGGPEDSSAVIGRQWLTLDDQRFLGTSAFRQNDQTYDAVKVETGRSLPVSVGYAYIHRVHRPLGDAHPLGELDSDSHVVEARKETPIGTLALYGLLLDFDNVPSFSSATYGARLTGKRGALGYRVEYARQADHRGSAADFDVGYLRASADYTHAWWTLGAGFEMLGGDGVNAFQTPLGTLHKFQGWADAFMTTPPAGLRDLHLKAEARWEEAPLGAPLKFTAEAHDFAAEETAADLGAEFDVSASAKIAPHLAIEAAAALFDGGDAGPADRTKVWLAMTLDL